MSDRCPQQHRSTDPDRCSECGMPMSDSVGLPRNPTFPIAPAARCLSCGAEWPGDYNFCPRCGTPYAAEPDPLTPSVTVADFEALIRVDRDYYDTTMATGGDERPPFPAYAPERSVRLKGDTIEIGRVHKTRRSPRPLPPINLAEKPAADTGVSHVHSVLQRDGDTWTVTDLDSKNGTFIAGVRLEGGVPRTLGPDEVVHLGFWTAIQVRRRGTERSRP